ncbi:dihydrofolate reductase [Pseudomonas phage Lu11]|uniref:dihydrofolate reductase n=1 Tax=Pseudomonas phage Lu11 TaxID=1161927 RepID=UPI00025F1803|nr:dihydrofolate reductase [Pseudomonas phage Lu11]AFH14752.1 dihydrofolate reductase [Pseudomonas phage Lu11]
MKLGIIFACDEAGGIGRDNTMPWHFPEELKHFKAATYGKPIILGRKTWESLGCKTLPGRPHIVVSSNPKQIDMEEGADVWLAESFDTALKIAEYLIHSSHRRFESDIAWVIGGANLIQQALPKASLVRITHVKGDFNCDVRVTPAVFNHIMVNRLQRTDLASVKEFDIVEYAM